MGCFIGRKNDKVASVFKNMGFDANEEIFIYPFKKIHFLDWLMIN